MSLDCSHGSYGMSSGLFGLTLLILGHTLAVVSGGKQRGVLQIRNRWWKPVVMLPTMQHIMKQHWRIPRTTACSCVIGCSWNNGVYFSIWGNKHAGYSLCEPLCRLVMMISVLYWYPHSYLPLISLFEQTAVFSLANETIECKHMGGNWMHVMVILIAWIWHR